MIKFRVYDTQEKRYLEESLDSNGQFELFIRPDGSLWSYEETGAAVGVCQLSPDRYLVERFTGFRDSAGREVYEGDLVKLKNSEPNPVRRRKSGEWVIGETTKPNLADCVEKAEWILERFGDIWLLVTGTIHDREGD